MVLKSRERILLIFVLIAIAIWVFDRFYYTPQSRRISALKEEVKAADLKLNEFLLLTKGVETSEAEVNRVESELKGLKERTVKGEEFRAFLKHLARESDPLQMKLISLIPGEEKLTLPDTDGKKAASFQLRKVTILMVLHSTYPKLGAYLKEIKELPFLINIESVQIERKEEILPLLKVTIGLSMYIISF
jgi:hypothetical protein